jgi:hypothetical protein
LGQWREAIGAAIDQELGGRAYEIGMDPTGVAIVWFTDRLEDETGPDLDNIAKPLLDGLRGKIIVDDRIVHEVHLRKVDLNHQFDPEPPLVFEAKAKGATEFVYVRVTRLGSDAPTRLADLGASR